MTVKTELKANGTYLVLGKSAGVFSFIYFYPKSVSFFLTFIKFNYFFKVKFY